MESNSKGELVASDDEDDVKMVHQVLSNLYWAPQSMLERSWVPPVERNLLLLLDKDLIECEDGT